MLRKETKMTVKEMIGEALRDATALGGLPLYALVTIIFAAMQKWIVFAELAIGLAAAYSLKAIVSTFFFKKRPKKKKYTNWFEKIDASSFPSTHSIRATVLGIMLAITFGNYWITALLVIGIATVGLTRIYFERHYWSDVSWGWAFGVIIAWLVLKLVPGLF